MNDALLMSGGEACGDRLCDLDGATFLHCGPEFKVGKCLAARGLKNGVAYILAVGAEIVELKYVRVRDCRRDTCLVDEAFLPTLVHPKSQRKHLESNWTVHYLVSTVIEIARFALTNEFANTVLICDQFARKFVAHQCLERSEDAQVAAKA